MGKCSEVCNVCLVTSDKNHFYEMNGDVGKGIESELFTEFRSSSRFVSYDSIPISTMGGAY